MRLSACPGVTVSRVHASFNNYDRAPRFPTGMSPSLVPQFYDHWKTLLSVIDDEDLTLQFYLAPGQLIAIDNWRLLHGRTGFSDASGRALAGCYIGRQETLVRFQKLHQQFGPGALTST